METNPFYESEVTMKKAIKYLVAGAISWGVAKYGFNMDMETTTALTVLGTSVILGLHNYVKHKFNW